MLKWRNTKILTCNLEMVSCDLLAPTIHSAVPGPRVPRLQVADHETVGGRVQSDPGRVNERRGSQLWSEDCHSGVLDRGQWWTWSTEPLHWADGLMLGFVTLQDSVVSNTNIHLITNWNKKLLTLTVILSSTLLVLQMAPFWLVWKELNYNYFT